MWRSWTWERSLNVSPLFPQQHTTLWLGVHLVKFCIVSMLMCAGACVCVPVCVCVCVHMRACMCLEQSLQTRLVLYKHLNHYYVIIHDLAIHPGSEIWSSFHGEINSIFRSKFQKLVKSQAPAILLNIYILVVESSLSQWTGVGTGLKEESCVQPAELRWSRLHSCCSATLNGSNFFFY